MAYLQAFYALDLYNVDLNFYFRNFYDDQFLNNEFYQIGGRTYEDVYWVNGYDGSTDLVLGFGGQDLSFNRSGDVTGGTITGMVELAFDGPELWRVQDISVSAVDVFNAATTAGNSDDLALIALALAGNDLIDRSASDDLVNGFDGRDRMLGRGGNDTIFGGNGADTVIGHSGNDLLFGGDGNDRLKGGGGSDTISGGNGNDVIRGGGKRDVIDGSFGDDKLAGGRGADTFVFGGDSGSDQIIGFRGNDMVMIQSGANSFAELDISANAHGVTVTFASTEILFRDLELSDLVASDFLFT